MAEDKATGLVYCPFADSQEAHRISHAVVRERLAACANILGKTVSVYQWQGAVTEAPEVAVLFKTMPEQIDPLIARITELHSYDVPAIIGWRAEHGTAAFHDWTRNRILDRDVT